MNGSIVSDADFSYSNSMNARLERCDFKGSCFRHSIIRGGDFMLSDISGTDFTDAKIKDCAFPIKAVPHLLNFFSPHQLMDFKIDVYDGPVLLKHERERMFHHLLYKENETIIKQFCQKVG